MYNLTVTLQYVRDADCFIIVYSITDAESFREAQAVYEWTKRIRDKPMPAVSDLAKFFGIKL